MAAGGYKEFVAGETLDQDEINDYLMQGMLVFAGTAARGSAIGTPVEGQFSYLADSDTVEFYDSTQWVPFASGVGAATISGTTGSPSTATSGGYTYYTFTGDGSIIVSEAGLCDLLVIAGGGAGGYSHPSLAGRGGAGGGAGGLIQQDSFYLPAGTATVTIGAGGAVGPSGGDGGFNGEATEILSVIPAGGGGGAGYNTTIFGYRGKDGGSAGGAIVGSTDAYRGLAQGSQGNRGGGGNGSGTTGGGGGGAGTVGQLSTSTDGGDGGDGKDYTTWATATSTGDSNYYAGGGGGAGSNTTIGNRGDGGLGGGGNSAYYDAPTFVPAEAGDANTGGGGGGGGPYNATSGNQPAAGGSGIVIVRVAV